MALTASLAGLPARATPPASPLELVVRALDPPTPGRPVRLEAVVTSRVPGERLRLYVVPPSDGRMAGGDSLLTGPAPAPGEARRLEARVRIPDGVRQRVYVRAELEVAGGHRFTRGANLELLLGPERDPPPRPRRVADGAGGEVLSFDGLPLSGARPAPPRR